MSTARLALNPVLRKLASKSGNAAAPVDGLRRSTSLDVDNNHQTDLVALVEDFLQKMRASVEFGSAVDGVD